MDDGLQKALAAMGGSQSKLARSLGLLPQSVQKWKAIPIKRVPRVSAVTGIPPKELRPDFFSDSPMAINHSFVVPNRDKRTKKADERTKTAKTATTQAQTGENHAAQ